MSTTAKPSAKDHPQPQRLRVEVERSGGFAGLTRSWALDSADLTPDDAARLHALVSAAAPAANTSPPPHPTDPTGSPAGSGPGRPDAFQFDVRVVLGAEHWATTAREDQLGPALRALVDHVRTIAPAPGVAGGC